MTYQVELAIICKPATLNPEDKVIGDALQHLGYDHNGVKKGKYLAYQSSQTNETDVRKEAGEIFDKVLTRNGFASFNTETYRVISISKLEEKAGTI